MDDQKDENENVEKFNDRNKVEVEIRNISQDKLKENQSLELHKISATCKELPMDNLSVSEAETNERRRFKSLYVVYFTLFLQSFGLAILIPSMWPYLQKLDPSSTKGFYSLILAANPLGQLLFSPLIGYWTNKSTSVRTPITSFLIIFIASNALYSSLDFIDFGVKYWMLVIRFFIGIASAIETASLSYVSSATKTDERTFAMSMVSLAQVAGFIVGFLLQSVFVMIGDALGSKEFMFIAPGWTNVLFGVINIVAIMPLIFTDSRFKTIENSLVDGEKKSNAEKLDYSVLWSLIASYFISAFNIVILESLQTPLMMEQFALSKEDSAKWGGIMMGIGGILSVIIVALLPRVSKMFKEINILIWGGIFVSAVGKLFFIPYRNDPPKLAFDREFINENGTVSFFEEGALELLGCPVKVQPWCEFSSALGVAEFVIGFFLGVIGYPVGMTLIQSLFSKKLGDHSKGTWTGVMLAAGSMSRIVGPQVVVRSYSAFGTGPTFMFITAFMTIPMVLIYTLRQRLIIETTKSEDIDVKNNNLQPV